MGKDIERLRPILTDNYRLDWLTHFNVKNLLNFRKHLNQPSNISDTANWVNDIMSQIMHKQMIIWGIESKNDFNLLGIIKLNNIKNKNFIIKLITDPNTSINWSEIIHRMILLIKQMFNIKIKIIITNDDNSKLRELIKQKYNAKIKYHNQQIEYLLNY